MSDTKTPLLVANEGLEEQPTRLSWKSWAGAAGCYAALIAFAWWGSSILAKQAPILPALPALAVTTANAATPRSEPAQPPAPTVRIQNPFDASEIFEFPAGTTVVEGRAKMAELLMQRARERRSHWPTVKPDVNLRTAKNL